MSEDFSTEIADGSVLVADTIEELAAKMEVPAANLQAALDTWNADMSAEQKADSQFPTRVCGLETIDTPPFYGIHRHVRVSAIVSGVNVDKHMQVLKDGTEEPIPGLFAIGNVAGNFFAGVDYTMWMPGLSLGRAHTQGYVIGKYVAEL